MSYKVVTAVQQEPITVAEARLQCKVDDDDSSHDGVLGALITAAREYAEHYTRHALAPQTLEMALAAFPCGAIELEMPPVASIGSIKYTDFNGVEQTLGADQYALSLYGLSRTVALAYGKMWPSTQCIPDAVRIRYTTGYVFCPRAVKAAMLLHVESEFPLNALAPEDRRARDRARDTLLDTIRIY